MSICILNVYKQSGGLAIGSDVRQSDRVYEALKEDIVNLRLDPGEPLPESALVARLEASRTPIREALQRLAGDGLVRLVPGRGAFVAEISVSLIIELFQLREGLEGLAARLAARASDRSAMQSIINELQSFSGGVPRERVSDYLDLTHRLDATTVRLAGNSRLDSHLRTVWEQVERVRNAARAHPSRLNATVAEHLAIASAIADGDEDRAALAVSQHVRESLRNFLGALSDPSAVPAPEVAL